MVSKGARNETATRRVILRAGIPAILSFSLIPLAFIFPLVDAARAPYIDLTGIFSHLAYWLSQSGGKYGAPFVAVSMLAIFVAQRSITSKRKWKETGVIVLVAAICAGGGAALNEHVLKPLLKVPRPNIIWLAGEMGSGPLGMTPEVFYESGGKEVRRELLAAVPLPLSPVIKAVWIDATGYSFPSGHAYSAMFLAVFFLSIGVTYLTKKRSGIFYVLLPWALAVCYSRSILRVHTPADITAGGALGLMVGIAAWILARRLIRSIA